MVAQAFEILGEIGVTSLLAGGFDLALSMFGGVDRSGIVSLFGIEIRADFFNAGLLTFSRLMSTALEEAIENLLPLNARQMAIEQAFLGPLGSGFVIWLFYSLGTLAGPNVLSIPGTMSPAREGVLALGVGSAANQITKLAFQAATNREAALK